MGSFALHRGQYSAPSRLAGPRPRPLITDFGAMCDPGAARSVTLGAHSGAPWYANCYGLMVVPARVAALWGVLRARDS